MRLLLCGLLAMLWPGAKPIAQTQATNIRPLSIGDTIPLDLEISNVYNYPASKIRLIDLRGKYVVLDFWGKYCRSCILALKKLDSLPQVRNGKIQVVAISDITDPDDLHKTLARYWRTQNLIIPVSLANDLLPKYFPHTLVSHLVWIDSSGVVKAITGSEYASQEKVQEMLSGRNIHWPLKKDVVDFDYKKPLLDFTQSSDVRPQSFYYSSLTTHMEGISAPNGTYIDSSRSVAVTLFYNQPLLNLLKLALDYRGDAKRDQFILNVKDTARYIRAKGQYAAEWKKQNTYSYYAQLPIGLSKKEIESFLRTDILRWLNILGIYAEKKTESINGKPQTKYIITERARTFI